MPAQASELALGFLAGNTGLVASLLVAIVVFAYRRYMNRNLSSRTVRTLTQFITRIISQLVQRADPARDTATREELELVSESQPQYEIGIWTSKALAKRRGRTPEQMVAKLLAKMFDAIGVGYRIRTGFVETPDTSLAADPDGPVTRNVLAWWRDSSRTVEYADSNLLLVDNRGGGWAYPTGKYGIAGASRIDSLVSIPSSLVAPRKLTEGAVGDLFAAVHEIGHNLGGSHDTPMLQNRPKLAWHPNMVEILKSSDET